MVQTKTINEWSITFFWLILELVTRFQTEQPKCKPSQFAASGHTAIQSVCSTMNSNNRSMLPEVHLTVPTSTSERSLSSPRRNVLLSYYLQATMTEKRHNNCMLLHVCIHTEITDDHDLVRVAWYFIDVNDESKIFLAVLLMSELYSYVYCSSTSFINAYIIINNPMYLCHSILNIHWLDASSTVSFDCVLLFILLHVFPIHGMEWCWYTLQSLCCKLIQPAM